MSKKIINVIVIVLVLTLAVGSIAIFTNGFDEYSFKVLEAKTRTIKEGDNLEGFYLNPNLKDFTKKDFDKLIEGIDPIVTKDESSGAIKEKFYVLVEFDSWTKEVENLDLEDITVGVLYRESGDIDLCIRACDCLVSYDKGSNSMISIFAEVEAFDFSHVSINFGGNVAHVSKVNNGKELKKWVGGIFA